MLQRSTRVGRTTDEGRGDQRPGGGSTAATAGASDSHVAVTGIHVDGDTVETSVAVTGRLRRFFTGRPFVAEYGVDVSDVPESVLVIPALAQACPVAWAAGADVTAPVVDDAFATSLPLVQDTLRRMYPRIVRGGRLHADRVTDPPTERPRNTGMLFSGGVDSLATYVRHREEDPTLVCVQGWAIQDDDRWRQVREHVRSFGDARGHDTVGVRANIRRFLDTGMLNAHYKHLTDGAWYSSLGHGLGLLGLCAPLAYAAGFDTLHIASSHWAEFVVPGYDWGGPTIPWGSHPDVDGNVRWTGTRCHHDGFEITRQDKLDLVADYLAAEDDDLVVRTCADGAGDWNCSRCEKCLRTIAGLLVAGVDPNTVGYHVDEAWFEDAVDQFEHGDWALDDHVPPYWWDIRDHLPPAEPIPYENADRFVDWLANADFTAYCDRTNYPLRDRAVRAIARNAPYPVLDAAFHATGRWV